MLLRQPPKGKPKDGATFNTRSSFFSEKHQIFVSSPPLLHTQEVRKKERSKQASNLLMGAIVQLGERLVGHFAAKKKVRERMLLQLETCQTLRDHSAKKNLGF
jgi:hypothetical protein